MHGGQLGSITSLATETTGGVILVATMAQKRSQNVPNFKKFSCKSMPPDPPSLFTLQWLYQSKIAGSSPEDVLVI